MAEVLFCKRCDWESPELNVGMKNECPTCKSSLHYKTVPDDGVIRNGAGLVIKCYMERTVGGHVHVSEGKIDPRGVF